ncbi:MAG: single-stranded-DNA-specific exonuclease RecJ [Rickettsiales bacterium]|nr:single-stranded-DNA-specific exonuclease RecJ [Rickettsiales bacterium]
MIKYKSSILGLSWQQKDYDERLAMAIAQRFELSQVLAKLIAEREISLDEIENFLNPKIKTNLPDPFTLLDMKEALEHVIDAIKKNKKITIFADYDVDGATSSALLKRFFREIGVDVSIYVPDRILEGYGPNVNALLNLKKSGTDLVITVDCGTVSFEPLEEAAKANLDIIVIDHHIGVTEKPKALAVINPNRIDENFPHKNICAAGVSFLFAVAINKALRDEGFYSSAITPPLRGSRHAEGMPVGDQNLSKATRFYSKETLEKAKELKVNQTDAENLLWYYLRDKQLDGHKFRRQQAIDNYIVDFVCLEKKLVVELDGGQHSEDKAIKYDQNRTEFLNKSGFNVLRFWNDEVFKNMEGVLDSVFFNLNYNPSPKLPLAASTLPQGEGKRREPNLLNLLDLVALGTVCDVMPLIGLNRALVAQGLKIIKNRSNLGIRTICDLAGLNEEPTAYHLGFVIGPRINAGGRVGKSDLGARILSSEDEEEVQKISLQLEEFNKQRKDIEIQIQEEAQNNLEKSIGGFSINDSVIFAVSNSWHQGVIGIVASRIKDLYNKPVAVITVKDGKGKASCRSINGVDFGSAILQARLEGLLIDGGGHAMAGGFSVLEEKIPELHKFFNKILGEKIIEFSSKRDMFFAAELDLAQINIELIKDLEKLEPFGMGNSKPKFIIRDLQKVRANLIGKNQDHISCIFSSKTAIGFSGNLQAVAFRGANSPLAEILLDPKFTKPINVAGQLNINSWMGVEKVQLLIEDILI